MNTSTLRLSRGFIGATALAVLLVACATSSLRDPALQLQQARSQAFARVEHALEPPIVSWSRGIDQAREVTVYIEGDGRAWQGRRRAPRDPTPRRSVAADLALSDPGAAIYLARPCQFLDQAARAGCARKWWTTHRYAGPVLDSLDTALDRMLTGTQNPEITIIAHSGGALFGAMLAVRRDDVRALVTIGAVLDPDAWARWHRTTPFPDAIRPLDFRDRLARLPQIHLAGENDRVVPPELLAEYLDRLGRPATAAVTVIDGQDHDCCWDRATLLRAACATSVPLATRICIGK